VTSKPILVLASNSPRRRELLALGGWMFHVRPADVDESPHPGEAPGDYVLRLAQAKAHACRPYAHSGQIIVAADTAVVIDDRLLGKPRDVAEAADMLRRLRGRSHQVFTGLAVLQIPEENLYTDLCVTDVPMRDYGNEEINAYVASGDPLDKAGGYAIQNAVFHPVEKLAGCYASVMGLPLCHLMRTLGKVNVLPRTDVPARCQAALHYPCPISSAVLNGEQVG
jgi:septum formation protein